MVFLRIRRLVSHMSSPRISMNEMPHAAERAAVLLNATRFDNNNNVNNNSEAARLKRKQKRRALFPHWGHLPERNVTTASPQWDKHSVCVCVSLALADIAAALALRAPRKRVTAGEYF